MKKKVIDKRIFIFSDGTGNSAGSTQKTNVWRMFEALEKDTHQGSQRKNEPVQLSFYDSGVGTSSLAPKMLLGQVFGIGLKQNVLEAYSFICTHYTPNSEIYLVGFSRGAFTMRILAALIGSQGILKVGFEKNDVDPAHLNQYARLAYQRLSDAFPTNGNFVLAGLRKARSVITKGFSKLTNSPTFEKLNRHNQLGKDNKDGAVDVAFMGLYDTVSAYGGPVEELTRAFNWLFWPAEPKDWYVGKYVKKICHALALDDPRHSFTPKLVTEAVPGEWRDPNVEPQIEEGNRIEQVWFAGAHANVGGGYANDGLSMIPLMWMISKLQNNHDVRFNKDRVAEFESNKDCCAPLNDPRAGLGGVYRYSPRNLNRLTEDMHNQIYVKVPKIHISVFKRIVENPGYAPFGLNKPYEIVDDAGKVQKSAEHKKLQPDYEYLGDIGVDAQTSTTRNPLESGNRYNPYIEKVWDLVWGKRVVYFAHLFFGLGLLAAPWLLDFFDKYRSSSEINCEGRSCLLNEPLDAIGATVNSFLPFGLTTEPWIASAKAYTGWVLPLALIWIVFYVVGMRQKKAVNTTLAQYWLALAGKANPPAEIKRPSKIYQLRSSQKYQQAFLGLKQYFLPWAWAGVLIFGATYGVNQASIYVRDHSIAELAYCSPADDKRQFAHVDTRKLCNDTGFDVVKGGLYEIAIAADIGCKIPEAKENDLWRDLTIPASASGVKPADRSYFAEAVGLAFKRSTSKKFFSPIIQLSNTFPEFPELTEHERWITDEGRIAPRWRFVATKTGRAYYYVNDGIIGFLPKSWQWFYQNNCGTGKLQLVKLS